MRVLLVSKEFAPYSPSGGIGTYTQTLAPELAEAGIEKQVLCFPSVGLSLLELSRLHRLLPRRLRGRLLQGAYLDGYGGDAAGEFSTTDWVPGTAVIVRRDAVRAVGLLDATFAADHAQVQP